jgi:hypothetical protein
MTAIPPKGRKWALLIGADFFMTGNARRDDLGNIVHYPNLGGCVNDIDLVECFLKEQVGVLGDHIIKLAAPVPHDFDFTHNQPQNDPSSWPTFTNIAQAFALLFDRGAPGDLVYIHYSGHGARVRTAFPNLKGVEALDEALVPLDIEIQSDNSPSQYIRDVVLALWLHRLVKKSMRVTIVLDSCHSGSANRSDREASERGTGVLDQSLLASDVDKDLEDIAISELYPRSSRDGEVQKNWLLEASGYTLLAACTAFQKSYEHYFTERKHGALTYFLVETLRSSPLYTPTSMLFSKISARVQSYFGDQTPLLEGNDEFAFFGVERKAFIRDVTVISVDLQKGFVELDHGYLHGVHKGAEYGLYETEPSPVTRVRVIQALGIRSKAAFTNSLDAVNKGIAPGARAVLTKQAPERQARVQLIGLQSGAARNLTTSWMQGYHREVTYKGQGPIFWRLVDSKDGEEDPISPDFTLGITSNGHYELKDSAQQVVPHLPHISWKQTDSVAHFARVINHVSHYQMVRRLGADQVSTVKVPFTFKLIGKSTNPPLVRTPEDLHHDLTFPSGLQQLSSNNAIYTVKNGDTISVVFQNNGNSELYIALLDLKPLWGIRKIYPSGVGWSECVGPGQMRNLPIRMSVPDTLIHIGCTEITETLKLIVTLQHTPLSSLELPDIEDSDSRGIHPVVLTTALDHLLEKLAAGSRTARLKGPSPGSWETSEIRIRTII